MSTALSPQQLTTLKNSLTGAVIVTGDSGYDAARQTFYGGIDKHPAVIVQVADTQDVVAVIKFAQETHLPIAVRSGGHSFAGHSVAEGGIVLDLRQMKNMDIGVAAQTVWAESGLTAGELTAAVDKHDLAIGFGDTGSVGIGGITLGGGVGFLARKFGLTIDNLLAAEVVTADGQILEVDASHHPDLFWAIRGGGGNFGVVTKFKFQLHSVSQAMGGMLILPAQPKALAQFMSLSQAAPAELSSIINVMPCPPMPFVPAEHHGQLVMMALMMYAGDPAQGEAVLAPFRTLATPIADQLKPMRYAEMFHPAEGSYHPTAVAQTMFLKQVDETLATQIVEQLQASTASMRVVQLRALGGAVSQVPVTATAFAHRHSPIMANIAAFYETETEKVERQAWVNSLAETMNQGDHGVYVNFLGVGDEDRIKDAYPAQTWQRLQTIKKQYDPHNFFHHNYNIPPAS